MVFILQLNRNLIAKRQHEDVYETYDFSENGTLLIFNSNIQ